MMKKLFILILLIIVLQNLEFDKIYAQTAKKTPTPTISKLQQQVDELKSKIASKVAELNLVEKRSFFGLVTDVSDTQITLKDLGGNTKFVDVDELTKFSSTNLKSFGISDVENDMWLGVLGLYNKQSRRLLARVVSEENALPNFIYGAVYSVDDGKFSIVVAKENGGRPVVDIENVTKTFSFENGKLIKSGFSKIKETETVIVIGFFDKSDKSRIVASRIILFPQISASPNIDLGPQDEEIVPSTGSGKKLTPIKQPSNQ